MRRIRVFGSAVLAGICIAIGGTAFLSIENKILGAVFFSAGLFTICTFGLHLFTGKVCYIFEKDRDYLLSLPVIWLGNLAGTWITAALLGLTRAGTALSARAMELCVTKLADGMLSIFVLSFFCNMLIYIAVDGYSKNPHDIGKYLSLFFGVTVFIVCGFEHCVANMFYFSMAGLWSFKTLLYIIVMTLGNACGGIFLARMRGFAQS